MPEMSVDNRIKQPQSLHKVGKIFVTKMYVNKKSDNHIKGLGLQNETMGVSTPA